MRTCVRACVCVCVCVCVCLFCLGLCFVLLFVCVVSVGFCCGGFWDGDRGGGAVSIEF